MEINIDYSKNNSQNQIHKKAKINSILDKIHSIQESINNKVLMHQKRKNLFQRKQENTLENDDYLKLKKKSRTKSKAKNIKKSQLAQKTENIKNYKKINNNNITSTEQSKNSTLSKFNELKKPEKSETNINSKKKKNENLYNFNKNNINTNNNIFNINVNDSKKNIYNTNNSTNNCKQKINNNQLLKNNKSLNTKSKKLLEHENNNISNDFIIKKSIKNYREYSDRNLSSKYTNYQEKILNKKKQLGVQSPTSILKTNFDISTPVIEDNTKNSNDNDYNTINDIANNNNHETNTNTNITDFTNNSQTNNPQVSTIISTINKIKYTKQIYNNRKKLFNESKLRQKKQKNYSTKNNLYNSALYSRPSYSKLRLRKNIVNDIYCYRRCNSKNVLSGRGKNMNLNNLNFKKSKKNLNESFDVVSVDNLNSSRSNNKLLLSNSKKRNKNLVKKSKIRDKSFGNIKDGKKTLNTSFNNNLKINDIISQNNQKEYLKNNTKDNTLSKPSIDHENNHFYSEINRHCDSLLSRLKKNYNDIKQNNTQINNKENNNILIKENKIKNFVTKNILSNASVCRKGLNRPDEPLKINQDNLFKIKFGDINYSYYGVCDGHGPNGHHVSEYVKSNLPFIVYKLLKNQLIKNNTINYDIDPNINFFISDVFSDSFNTIQQKLDSNKEIDQELSGTTCISILFCSSKIISANVGDSRALIGKYSNKEWKFELLSRDHKPSDEDEAERIYSCSGIVHPFIDDNGNFLGPDRVWQVDDELPGLAMSRSIGDKVAKNVGVIAEPEVKIFDYNYGDKFVVIASDGLWEYVSNEEVLDIVSFFYEVKDCDGAVSKLYEEAHARWVKYDEYIDDISIIVIFLE